MSASEQSIWHFSRVPFLSAAKASVRGCFETSAWVQSAAVARNRRHWPIAWRASKEDCEATLLGAVHLRLGVPVFESMPMGGYGGWLGDVEDLPRIERAWLSRALFPVVIFHGRPNIQIEHERLQPVWPSLSCRNSVQETHILDLGPSAAELLAKVKPSVRSYLRRVDQLGFVFSVGGIELLESFMSIYASGKKNWLRKPMSDYSIEYFRSLLHGENSEIWLVAHEGVTVGAAFFVKGAKDVLYIASGVHKVSAPISPMDALVWSAILNFQQRGYAVFNMGASRGLDSVRRFKEKFGARPHAYLRTVYFFPALTIALNRFHAWIHS